MSAPFPKYEMGDTRQFIVTYSSAPGTTPRLLLYTGSGMGTLVLSQTGTASSSTNFFVNYTLPDSVAYYAFTWIASYTSGPVLTRGLFKVARTDPG